MSFPTVQEQSDVLGTSKEAIANHSDTFPPHSRLSVKPQPYFQRSPWSSRKGSRGLRLSPAPEWKATVLEAPMPWGISVIGKCKNFTPTQWSAYILNQTLRQKYSLFQAPFPYLPITKRYLKGLKITLNQNGDDPLKEKPPFGAELL